ncbi:MAG TPA: DUF5069 domain-containing protein [Verrucomicrobiae bacterium]|jgi:hypothetical protein|nr:DUF5069 domain-containing protein [Verrucomicrobiae bacterium]
MSATKNSITAKDLTKQAPTSPRQRTGGYVILSRMADKARADIAGKIGDYHTDCPLDHILLDWKGVPYAGVRKALEGGATDEEIAKHLDANGAKKTPAEIKAWSDSVEKSSMHGHPEKGGYFDGECRKLGLDPAKTSTFDWLEADDKASFSK